MANGLVCPPIDLVPRYLREQSIICSYILRHGKVKAIYGRRLALGGDRMISNKRDVEIVVYERNEEDDPRKLRFDKLCEILKSKNIFIIRYVFVDNEELFRQNRDLWTLITRAGLEMLPATYVNGIIQMIEEYPAKKQKYRWIEGSSGSVLR